MGFTFRDRVRAVVVGLLVGALAGAPMQALAASPTGTHGQDGSYAPQQVPVSSTDYENIALSLAAGLTAFEAIPPQPHPYRDYVAFLTKLWDSVFATPFIYGSSGLFCNSWVVNGTGMAQGTTDTGVSFDLHILLSVAYPPDDRIGMTPSQAAMFEAAGASFGIAWVEIASSFGVERVLATWLRYRDDAQNQFVTVVAPIQFVSDVDWDRMAGALPIFLNYLEEIWDSDDDFEMRGDDPSEEFERKATWSLRRALIAAGTVVVGTAVAVVAALGSSATAATVAATIILAQIAAIISIGGIYLSQLTELAELFEDLRRALRNGACGFPSDQIDVDALTWQELLDYARQYCRPV